MADAALAALSSTSEKMYSGTSRPSIPPEQLLKSCLLMAFYSVRSERLFCEQLDYNLLFRWFPRHMGIEDVSFDHSTFSQSRDRLLKHDVAPLLYGGGEPGAERRRAAWRWAAPSRSTNWASSGSASPVVNLLRLMDKDARRLPERVGG